MAARTPFAFYPSRAALDAAHRAWIAGLRPGWQAGPLEALTKPLEAHPSDWTCKALVSPYNRPSTPLAPALALQSLASGPGTRRTDAPGLPAAFPFRACCPA